MINPRKDLIIISILLTVTGVAAYLAYKHGKVQKEAFNVLVCSDAGKGARVVGISSEMSLEDGIYWLKDTEGNQQSYFKSEWEWCATLGLAAAQKQGLIP